MKKNISKFVFLAFLFYATESSAVLWPPCPICPSFDGINDVIETGKAILKKARTVVDDLQYQRDQFLNNLKSAKKFIALDFTESPLKKEINFPVIADAKEIATCQIADITDPASLSNGFKKLFLENDVNLLQSFPVSYHSFVLNEIDKKRSEFAFDNMMEIYVSAEKLQEERLPALKAELESMTECFVEGKEGVSAACSMASATDEELGNWVNTYKLETMRDSTMRLLEELVAMKAQYQSGNALREGVRPFNEDLTIKEENVKDKENMSFHYLSEEKMAFAQLAGTSVARVESTKSAPKVNPDLELLVSEETKTSSPFEGSEELVKSLPILNGAYELLSLAKEMHNTKQQMPDLRKPFIEYEKMKALHEEAINRLAKSEMSVRDYLSDYYGTSNANDIWFGNTCKIQSVHLGKKCPNIMGCKTAKEYVDASKWNIICSSGAADLTSYERRSFDSLSGVAIRDYKLSKAEKVLALAMEDISNPDKALDNYDRKMPKTEINMDISPKTPDMDKEADVKDYVKDADRVSMPSDNKDAEDTTREQNLNRWQIGAERSVAIGQDMESSNPEYGFAYKKYPVWTDEKRFYRQYLKEKYRNMVIYFESGYLESAIFDIASNMNETMTIDEEKLKSKIDTEVNSKVNALVYAYAASLSADDPSRQAKINAYRASVYDSTYKETSERLSKEANDKLLKVKGENRGIIASAQKAFEAKLEELEKDSSLRKMKEAQDKEMAALIEGTQKKIESLENKKQNANDDLEAKMEELSAQKAHYNDLMEKKKSAEAAIVAQDQSMKMAEAKQQESEEKKATYNDPRLSYDSGMKDTSEKVKKEKEAELVSLKENLETALEGVEELQDDVDNLSNVVENIDHQIEEVKTSYIEQAVEMENKHIQAMKVALATRSASAISFDPSSVSGSSPTLQYALKVGQNMMNIFKEAGIKTIKETYAQLLDLGEDLYNPDAFGKIKSTHEAMLSNLAKVAFGAAIAKIDDLVISNTAILAEAPQLFYQIIFKSDCEGAKCKEEDAQYFVSLKGRARDFTVPRKITPERTAPIREVFHFDLGDFDYILKTKGRCPKGLKSMINPKTIRAEFLNVGEQIPKIWTYILLPDGFVDRDVDLEDILNPGSPDLTSKKFLDDKGEGGQVNDVGELSIFLKYDNGLTFTNPLYDLVCYFEKAETAKKVDEDEYHDNEKKFLGRNQIGDYLQFVDNEQVYQTSMDKLKVKVDEGREAIEEVLSKIDCSYKPKETGYLPDSDVETKIVSSEYIADQETYEAILKCLDNGKNLFISEAEELLKQLPADVFASYDYDPVHPEYTNVRSRKQKIDNMANILMTDFDELVSISDNSTLDDVKQQMTTKETDNTVVNKYDKAARDEFEKNLDNMPTPYRAKYF